MWQTDLLSKINHTYKPVSNTFMSHELGEDLLINFYSRTKQTEKPKLNPLSSIFQTFISSNIITTTYNEWTIESSPHYFSDNIIAISVVLSNKSITRINHQSHPLVLNLALLNYMYTNQTNSTNQTFDLYILAIDRTWTPLKTTKTDEINFIHITDYLDPPSIEQLLHERLDLLSKHLKSKRIPPQCNDLIFRTQRGKTFPAKCKYYCQFPTACKHYKTSSYIRTSKKINSIIQ